MLKKNEKVIVVIGLILVLTVALIGSRNPRFGSSAGGEGTATYIVDPVNDQVVSATPAILQRIIVGGRS